MDARECDGRRHEAMTGGASMRQVRRGGRGPAPSPAFITWAMYPLGLCHVPIHHLRSLILPHPIWPGTLQPWAFTCPRPSSPQTRTPSSGAHTCATDTGGERNKRALVGGSICKPRRQEGLSLLSKGQGSVMEVNRRPSMRGIIHNPKPTAHSQTYRTGEPRARHHHPPSLSPAVLLAVSTSSAVEYVIA